MRIVLIGLLMLLASQVIAEKQCDVLGFLRANPNAVAEPVDFADIEPLALISACDEALSTKNKNSARYILQRARGYLRLGETAKALSDIKQSQKMGYPAATFALATTFFLGDDTERNYATAEKLFLEAYDRGVVWAARGLASSIQTSFPSF